MFNLFDYFILTPLRLFFQGMYEVILIFNSNYGIGIIGLSCVTALILIPIEKAVRGSILKEKKIEAVLQPQLSDIKHKYSGIEKNNAIKRLYRRYGYSPLYAIRNVYGVLVQLPFLFGAYLMLSSYSLLNGQSFLFIKDLSQQDQLLGQINLLPIMMTAINLSTLMFLNLSRKENIQAIAIAIAFLALLYTAPSALLLYWTMNNVIHLLRAIIKKYICFNEIKKHVTDNVKILVNQFCKTTLGKYLKSQLIDKPECEYYKKNWIYFVVLIFLLPIAGISKNFGFYSSEQVARSICFLLLLAFIFLSVFFILKKVISGNKVGRLFLLWILVIFGAAVFYQSIGHFLVHTLPKAQRVSIIGSLFIIVFFVCNFKTFNLILFTNILVAIIYGGIENYNAANSFIASIKEVNQNDSLSIRLNEKPNLYYILCESMNSLDIAQNTYGLDKKTADEFVDFLRNNGFYVPEYVYSNAHHTLKTMQTVYLMNNYVGGNKGNDDGSTLVRPMLAGNEFNKLLKILKNNGYYTSSYMLFSCFGAPKGKYLDYYDVDTSSTNNITPLIDNSKLLTYVLNHLTGNQITSFKLESKDIIEDYFKNEPPQPHFMFHRTMYTFHTALGEGFSIESRKHWIKSKDYLNAYYKEIEVLKFIAKKIIDNDPDAVIIMIGDHGAHLYRSKANNIEELKKELKNTNITYEDFINDNFKVFAAVRIPKKYKQIDNLFSPGNVFAKIFNNIGYSNGKIEIGPNNSFFAGYVGEDVPIIEDGKIVPLENLVKKIR